MRSRLTTMFLVLGLVVFGAGGAYAGSSHLGLALGHHKGNHGKKHAKKHHRRHHGRKHTNTQNQQGSNGTSSAQTQYGTRPGKGCGDRNHVHTGPPGNPSNTACPPQSKHSSTSTTAPSATTHHHGRHHGHKHKNKRHGKHKGTG